MRVLALLFLSVFTLCAQIISVGVKGGIVPTDTYSGLHKYDESRSYIVGPSVEFTLRKNLSLEVDALYRRIGYRYEFTPSIPSTVERASSWEFPVLAKYLMANKAVRPFMSAGWSWRMARRETDGYFTGIWPNSGPPGVIGVPWTGPPSVLFIAHNTSTDQTNGPSVATGLDYRLGPLLLSPELRYTHWNQRFPAADPASSSHQLAILLGFRWP
jgi:hypothetical protein